MILNVLTIVIFTAIVLVALLLIGLVLIQQAKGGMGGALGGAVDSAFGAHTGTHLTKLTVVMASLFLILSLGLGIITGHRGISKKSDKKEKSEEVEGAEKKNIPAPEVSPEGDAKKVDGKIEAPVENKETTDKVEKQTETKAEKATEDGVNSSSTPKEEPKK